MNAQTLIYDSAGAMCRNAAFEIADMLEDFAAEDRTVSNSSFTAAQIHLRRAMELLHTAADRFYAEGGDL